MSMSLLILGVGSAVPTVSRNPSAQLLELDGTYYLIDCGEGTQIQLRNCNVKMQRIKHIFISHMHGDHYLGLMGLLWTMSLLGRSQRLSLYGPPTLKEIIDLHLSCASGNLGYELKFISTDVPFGQQIHEDSKVIVSTIQLKHKIRCTGFLFREKTKPRKLIKEKIDEYNIPVNRRKAITEGKDFFDLVNDRWIPNEELTTAPRLPRSFAYCADTAYSDETSKQVEGVDLLYHEATFLEEDRDRAKATRHSTAGDAALVAKKASVKQLIIGHYSNRYKDLNAFLKEARLIFKNTVMGEEGKVYQVE